MNNDGRETVIVPEKKEKIERIKRKYNNMEMADDTAKKIRTLEVVNNVLIAATGVVGCATVINYFVPDALPFVDEAVMTGATALLGSASTIVKNKIDSIIFSDLSVKKKRIALRKLKKDKLEPKYINMFIGLLDFIEKK